MITCHSASDRAAPLSAASVLPIPSYLLLIQTFLDSLLADAVRPTQPSEENQSLLKKH